MTTEDQVKSILERILRLKEEQDEIGEQVREIYAEAKSNGFDKTALGIVVTTIRKRDKDPQKYAEHDQLATLYLAAYDGSGTELADISTSVRGRAGRLPKESYQPPRLATLSEIKESYRAGRPISGDARHWNGFVYIAECMGLGKIKVGVTNDVAGRMAALSREQGYAVTLLDSFKGDRQEELRTQEALAKWKIEGEWFRDTTECRAAIDAIMQSHRVGSGRDDDDLEIPAYLRREPVGAA